MKKLLWLSVAIISLSAFATSSAWKEGIRVSVTSVSGDSVRIDIVGSFMTNRGVLYGVNTFTESRPYHATTPFELWPFIADGPTEIRAVQGKKIKAVVDNMITYQHLEGTARVIRLSRQSGSTRTQLEARP
jgi:hypothetical protein